MLLLQLDSSHRDAMCAHLLALAPDDRASRFMAAVSDDLVRRYVGDIAYGRDRLIGALRQRTLLGLVHAAVDLEGGDRVIEVGVSRWLPWRAASAASSSAKVRTRVR